MIFSADAPKRKISIVQCGTEAPTATLQHASEEELKHIPLASQSAFINALYAQQHGYDYQVITNGNWYLG